MLRRTLVRDVSIQLPVTGKMTIVGQKYDLPVSGPLNDKGVFTEEGGPFEGMFYDKANKAVTDLLKKKTHYLNLTLLHIVILMIGVRKTCYL